MTDYRVQAGEADESGRVDTGKVDEIRSASSSNRVVKTSMTLPQSSVDTIRSLAEATGSTMAEVVRKAVAMEKFLSETTQAGGKILIKEKGNPQLKELLIR